jgi:L,D-transpeptidase ErfK/SrfK
MQGLIVSLLLGLMFSAPIRATLFDLPDPQTRVVGHNLIVLSKREDTLLDIARRFDLGYSEIVSANPGVDVWLPGVGQRVVVPTRFILPDAPRQGIIINLAEMRLYYYPKPEKGSIQQVITHPLGIGREGWETPLGRTKIIQKKKDPTWTPPASILAEHLAEGDPLPKVVPAGPDNPLGAFAMRLGIPGYLLHGTNKPYGVGLRVSHGCIRLFPEDIEHLFGKVDVNTSVEIIHESYKAANHKGVLFIEAHAHQQDMDPNVNNMTPMVSAILKEQDQLDDEDWLFAQTAIEQQQGIVRPINALETAVIEDVWFLHAGLAEDSKQKLNAALQTLNADENFWPINGAVGEVLLGPFENKEQAKELSEDLSRLMGQSVWLTLVAGDVL